MNKIALIVGASSDLGIAAGQLLSRAGYFVGINDWAPAACEKVVREIAAEEGLVAAYPADPSKKLAFQTMLEHFLEEHGRIDLLINASAIEPGDNLIEMDEWDWRRALDLNLTSLFVSTQSVGRVMRDLGGGSIVNLLRKPEASSSFAYRTAISSMQSLAFEANIEFAALNIQVVALLVDNQEKELKRKIAAYIK